MQAQTAVLTVAAILCLPLGASGQERPKGQMMEAIVSVTKVDPATRKAYVRGPKSETVVTLPPSVNPSDILPGTRYKVRYEEPVAVMITPGAPSSAGAGATAEVTTPATASGRGEVVKTAEASGVVESIDPAGPRIVLRTLDGGRQTFAVAPSATVAGPVKTGDAVTVAYHQGATTEITRSPQPERDPAPAP
jgi:hypothetical protein